MKLFLLGTWSLAKRELVRFYRQRSRIVGSLAMPVIFWALLGTGLSAAFPDAGGGDTKEFLRYFFPGNLVLTLMFTSIFSTISLIEDRHQGFLQSVLVSPVPLSAVVAGKVLGGAAIAVMQGVLFLLLAPLAGFTISLGGIFSAVLAMLVMALGMTALGFAFAWKIDSVQGFHAVMNLVLFPMWLLSGSFFPVERAPWVLKPVMYLNPMTYGLTALREALVFGGWDATFLVATLIAAVFALVFYLASVFTVTKLQGASVG